MTWQLRDPTFRKAIVEAVEALHDQCSLAGTVGAQIHIAAAIGIEKRGPPAHGIQLVSFDPGQAPTLALGVPVEVVDALGFEASLRARSSVVEIDGQSFPVAAPEHVLGLALGAPELPPDAQWACFVLMRICGDELDLEEVRGFLKRSAVPDRQALLAELAYLAA